VSTAYKKSGERNLQINTHLGSVDCLKRFLPGNVDQVSLPIQQLLQGSGQQPYTRIDTTTPAMQAVLEQVLQQQEQAAAVLAEYARQINQAQANLADYQGKSVLLLSMSDLKHIGIFDEETFAGHLLEAVGLSLLRSSDSALDPSGFMTSIEILPQFNPDFVIVMASGDSRVEQIQTLWDEHPVLRSHPTYQSNQVYFVDYQLWNRINGPIAAELVLDEIQAILLPSND
jgi:iron complex transport system substrate-binding protein